MSNPTTEARQERIDNAMATVRDLFARHGITDRNMAKVRITDRFTPDELDTYLRALSVLMGEGALG